MGQRALCSSYNSRAGRARGCCCIFRAKACLCCLLACPDIAGCPRLQHQLFELEAFVLE